MGVRFIVQPVLVVCRRFMGGGQANTKHRRRGKKSSIKVHTECDTAPFGPLPLPEYGAKNFL